VEARRRTELGGYGCEGVRWAAAAARWSAAVERRAAPEWLPLVALSPPRQNGCADGSNDLATAGTTRTRRRDAGSSSSHREAKSATCDGQRRGGIVPLQRRDDV